MNRTILFTVTSLLLAVQAPLHAAAADAPAKRPKIIFFLSDDHAAHAIGCYGGPLKK